MNPLLRLREMGQSAWYDNIQRKMLESGELARMVAEDGLCGVTSNPTIFEKAIAGSQDYDASLAHWVKQGKGHDARELFFTLAIEDIQAAADIMRPVHESSGGQDGMISLEVSPDLAYDTEATVAEALRLFRRIGRPNAMIKVPATREGVRAFERLTAEGINVNVTLLFSVERYKEVVEAHLRGLETRLSRGQPLHGITSVASFFVSRVDSLLDKLLAQKLANDPARLAALQGKIAIANARIAYQWYKEVYNSPRYVPLRNAGGAPQRLLWASTGTKNPAYSDVLYIDELVGPETVNTIPPATYKAYKDHGKPRLSLEEGIDAANASIAALRELNIDLAAATEQLEKEGVESFAQSFRTLLDAIRAKAAGMNPRASAAG